MGKINEVLQWIVILAVVVYVIVVSSMAYAFLGTSKEVISEHAGPLLEDQIFLRTQKQCVSVSDCGYGSGDLDPTTFLTGPLQDFVTPGESLAFTGCLNSEQLLESLDLPSGAECACIDAQCKLIS